MRRKWCNSLMRKAKAKEILTILEQSYGNPGTELSFNNPFQLLVATILSAQCTDERVNAVTPILFNRFAGPDQLSEASQLEIEEIIKSCGLYRNKTKNLIEASKILVKQFGGKVPDNMKDLMKLPGVGRKTANVVLSNAFNKDAIAVDTHVFRVANRLGLTKAANPLATEHGLMKMIPKKKWSQAHHWLIYHGRRVCKARRPRCMDCPVAKACSYWSEKGKS